MSTTRSSGKLSPAHRGCRSSFLTVWSHCFCTVSREWCSTMRTCSPSAPFPSSAPRTACSDCSAAREAVACTVESSGNSAPHRQSCHSSSVSAAPCVAREFMSVSTAQFRTSGRSSPAQRTNCAHCVRQRTSTWLAGAGLSGFGGGTAYTSANASLERRARGTSTGSSASATNLNSSRMRCSCSDKKSPKFQRLANPCRQTLTSVGAESPDPKLGESMSA